LNDDCTPQTLTFRVVTPPAHGTVTLDNPNSGAFSYRPNTGYSGTDSFTFQVNDGVVDADTPGTFTLTVANQPPETADGQGTTREGSPFLGQFTGSDPDLPVQALTFIVESQPPKGNVVVTDAGAGRFTYTPNPGVFGQDSFTFRVTDGLTNSATRTFTIGIRPRLDPGDLLVTDLSSRALVLIDPTGAQFALSTTNLIQSPEGLAVEAQGTIILKDKGSGLVRVNPADGSQTLVSSATNFAIEQTQAYGLGVEADGSILVPDGTNGLIRVHPVTGVASVLSTGTPFVYPRGVTVAPDGTIYVADLSGFMGQPSRVIRVHPDTGAATLVATNHLLILPTGIVVDRQGMLVVADAGGYAGAFDSVLRINPNGGSQTAVCTNGLLSTPMGLALGSDGTIFVANLQGQSIVKIDPVTGAQSIFASGGLLGMPLGLAIVPPPSAVLRLTLVQIIPQEAIVRLEGKASQHHELLRSADLVSWSKVAEGTTGPNGVLDLQDTNRPADKAFDRAVEQ
jgi:sugar lactone lactonase YvrE